jgi:hypothetical protein
VVAHWVKDGLQVNGARSQMQLRIAAGNFLPSKGMSRSLGHRPLLFCRISRAKAFLNNIIAK